MLCTCGGLDGSRYLGGARDGGDVWEGARSHLTATPPHSKYLDIPHIDKFHLKLDLGEA